MRPTRHQGRRGFTLVEILVVVIILGIAGAMIVPAMSTRDDLKAAAAARMLMADLIYAQNLAITRQTNHYVQFDLVTQRYSVLAGPGMTVVMHPVNQAPYTVVYGDGGTAGGREAVLVAAGFSGTSGSVLYPTLGFDELGTPVVYLSSTTIEPMSAGSITLRVGQHRLRVAIEPYTGQITVTPI
jgi:prepilin-type N-terminal cleavage/methylation domain-containing protein